MAALATVAMVNFAVDPYGLLGRNTVGLYFLSERQIKQNITTIPHDAIIIGSSRVAKIDPEALHAYRFYNASFSSALPEEIYAYLKDYAFKEKVVLIGLDFYMFNEATFPLVNMRSFSSGQYTTYEYLLSLNVLLDSFKALTSHAANKKPLITEEGQYVRPGTARETFDPKKYIGWLDHYREENYRDYAFSEERIQIVKQTRDLLKGRGIKAVFFINPEQRQIAQLTTDPALAPLYLRWKARLKAVIPDIVDLTSPVYGYTDPGLYEVNDPSHYLSSTGALFVNRILEKDLP